MTNKVPALLLASLACLLPSRLAAEEAAPAAQAPAAMAPDGGAASADTASMAAASPGESAAPPVSPDSLLPAIMGPMEHVFWGKSGLMRHLGMPLNEETREKEIFLRRNLLTAHQIGGFITLAAMTATAVTGQQILNGRDDLGDRKRLLVSTTIITYFTTAALAAITPPPMVRRPQWSSISWHKALATLHFTGMIVTPILGSQIKDDYDRRHLHQWAGYATLATFAGAMLVVTF